MAQGKPQPKFEEISALGSEIIATQTDGRQTNFDVMSSADIVKQSEAELKMSDESIRHHILQTGCLIIHPNKPRCGVTLFRRVWKRKKGVPLHQLY